MKKEKATRIITKYKFLLEIDYIEESAKSKDKKTYFLTTNSFEKIKL